MASRKGKSSVDDPKGPDSPSGSDGNETRGGELNGSPRMGTAVISGLTFTNKAVTYYDVDGVAIIEGDIAIGLVSDIEAQTAAARDAAKDDPLLAHSLAITGSRYRWPNCVIPYEIDPALPQKHRVTDAVAHWEAKTPIRFPLRTAANQGHYPNYVYFTDEGRCSSYVGMQGGRQIISLGPRCSTGNAIHEIGHAVGLWHEQSREDRDMFITIQWLNIQDGYKAQFNQHITDGDDVGPYDYASIMHYPKNAFSKNGQDTIIPTDPAAVIGQRNGLSPGDIAGVREIYRFCGLVLPPKPPWREAIDKLLQDGFMTNKKITDDQRFKKLFDEPKLVRDPKGVTDPNLPRGPIPGAPGTVGQPGGTLYPFSLATPHHADLTTPAATGHFDAEISGYLAGMGQQLLDLDAGIAAAVAQGAQAQAEAARMQKARDELALILVALSSAGSA